MEMTLLRWAWPNRRNLEPSNAVRFLNGPVDGEECHLTGKLLAASGLVSDDLKYKLTV